MSTEQAPSTTMDTIVLRHGALKATFLPRQGMNLASFRKGHLEVIDQSTRPEFEQYSTGLGPLIGPHYGDRNREIIPHVPDPSLFPHFPFMQARGSPDYFHSGVGRYAPWQVLHQAENTLSAVITGKQEWNGTTLGFIENQNFRMACDAELSDQGLRINLSVVSDSDSVVGFAHRYLLPGGKGTLVADVENKIWRKLESGPIPKEWNYSNHRLQLDLPSEVNTTFHPILDPLHAQIRLQTSTHCLQVSYQAPSQQNCWHLYRKKNAPWVSIQPLSAKWPSRPTLTVSSLSLFLDVIEL